MTKSVNKGQGNAFQIKWIINFGLEIAARDPQTGDIYSVKCQFCENGCDPNDNMDNDRKRKRTERTKYYQRGAFPKDNIVRHLTSQHNVRWLEYEGKT